MEGGGFDWLRQILHYCVLLLLVLAQCARQSNRHLWVQGGGFDWLQLLLTLVLHCTAQLLNVQGLILVGVTGDGFDRDCSECTAVYFTALLNVQAGFDWPLQ